MSANVRAETMLGKRRTNRLRRNMFLRSSLRFPNLFLNFFESLFPNFSKEFGKIGSGKNFKKVKEKMVQPLYIPEGVEQYVLNDVKAEAREARVARCRLLLPTPPAGIAALD
jgi:hypothetical protein